MGVAGNDMTGVGRYGPRKGGINGGSPVSFYAFIWVVEQKSLTLVYMKDKPK